MALMRFESTVLDIKKLTPTVKHITFSVPDDFDFQPGQFVSLVLELPDGKTKRSYSIASSPLQKSSIEICIKKIEGGKGSTFLHELEKGAKLEVIGPFGTFALKDTSKPIIFIATGTGIAPFRSMIQTLLKQGHRGDIILLTGVRYQNEILYKDEWLIAEQKYKNFKYYSTCSRPIEPYIGHRGRIQSLIEEVVPKDFKGDFYLCGLSPMITDVTKLLTEKGFSKSQFHFERYD